MTTTTSPSLRGATIPIQDIHLAFIIKHEREAFLAREPRTPEDRIDLLSLLDHASTGGVLSCLDFLAEDHPDEYADAVDAVYTDLASALERRLPRPIPMVEAETSRNHYQVLRRAVIDDIDERAREWADTAARDRLIEDALAAIEADRRLILRMHLMGIV